MAFSIDWKDFNQSIVVADNIVVSDYYWELNFLVFPGKNI